MFPEDLISKREASTPSIDQLLISSLASKVQILEVFSCIDFDDDKSPALPDGPVIIGASISEVVKFKSSLFVIPE